MRDVVGRIHDYLRQEHQLPVAQHADDGSVDDPDISAVITGCAQEREPRSRDQALSRKGQVLVEYLVGQLGETVRQKRVQSEQLQLLGNCSCGRKSRFFMAEAIRNT